MLVLAIAIGGVSLQPANAQDYRDEVPEIGWSSRLSSMGLNKADNVGKIYNFYCQPAAKDSLHAPIWGTNIYTVNSGICSTAVHAGMISQSGGTVKRRATTRKRVLYGKQQKYCYQQRP